VRNGRIRRPCDGGCKCSQGGKKGVPAAVFYTFNQELTVLSHPRAIQGVISLLFPFIPGLFLNIPVRNVRFVRAGTGVWAGKTER